VDGKAGDVVRLDIALAEPAHGSGADAAASGGASSSSLATWGLVVGAVGIAGLVTGAVSGALASSARSDLADAVNGDPRCSGGYPHAQCDPAAEARLRPIQDRAFVESTVSTIAFIAGGVLLAGGVVMYVLAPSSAAPGGAQKSAASRVRIRIGASGALEGSF
jgi:hypothetical protein